MQKLNIALSGATGRMGKAIEAIITNKEYSGICFITSRIDSKCSVNKLKEHLEKADIVIDFSSPSFFPTLIEAIRYSKKPAIIATTGLSKQDNILLNKCASDLPLIYAANTSVGANLAAILSEKMARCVPDFDVEIIETHHKNKKDAPSGTALMLGEAIASAKNDKLDEIANYNRFLANAPKKHGEIGFSSIRSGGVYGRHEILFGSDNETISISHDALSREVFASGALLAAKWLINKKPGLYSMRDVLDL